MATKKKEENKISSSEIILLSICSTVLIGLILFVIVYGLSFKTDSKTKMWNVYFSRIINNYCSEHAICTTPTVYTSSTSTGDYTVEFSSPGQSAIYEVTVKNEGLVNAELTSVILSTPTCHGNSSDPASAMNDATNVCNHLKYKLTDEDGNTITLGDSILASESKKYYLRLLYNDESYYIGSEGDLSNTVTVSNLNVVLNYAQVE